MASDKERTPTAEPEQEQGKAIELPPQIVVTVMPDGNIDLKIEGLTPWHMIGIAEVIKAQAFGLMASAQIGGLVTPPRKGIHLPGRPS